MMTLEQLKVFDETIMSQIQWDEKNIDRVLRRIPDLKIKILGKWTSELDNYNSLEIERLKFHGDRFKYLSEDSPRSYPNRKDIEEMINRDPDYCELCNKVKLSETVGEHLNKMIKILTETDWNIRNWLDVKKAYRDFGSV